MSANDRNPLIRTASIAAANFMYPLTREFDLLEHGRALLGEILRNSS